MANRTYLFLLLLPVLALTCPLTASPVTGDQAGTVQPADKPV